MTPDQMANLAERLRYFASERRREFGKSSLNAAEFDRAADLIEQMAQAEPVAVRHGFDGHGWLYLDNGSGSDWLTRHTDAEPLYLAPSARKPLSDEQVRSLVRMMDWPPSVLEIARAVEQAHEIRSEK